MELDPNLFHIDYPRLVEVLITLVIFSFFVERALAVVFESRPFIDKIKGIDEVKDAKGKVITPERKKKKGVRELIAVVVSVTVCWLWQFDALTILLVSSDTMTYHGIILTGLIVAGGSKASVTFFKDVMGFMSTAEAERKAAKAAEREANK